MDKVRDVAVIVGSLRRDSINARFERRRQIREGKAPSCTERQAAIPLAAENCHRVSQRGSDRGYRFVTSPSSGRNGGMNSLTLVRFSPSNRPLHHSSVLTPAADQEMLAADK